jgi:hypothetical protein
MEMPAVISEGYHVVALTQRSGEEWLDSWRGVHEITPGEKMCHFEGYVYCVHPWDVLRGVSNSSDLDAAKKGARRKQQFLDAFANSRNSPINFIMSVRPS